MILIIYVAFAFAIGWFGRDRVIGFAGWFLLGMVFTPPVAAMILLFTQPAKR